MTINDFPRDRNADAWGWLEQSRAMNFDDTGPRTFEAFEVEMQSRRDVGESIFGVWDDAGELCGIVGWRPMTWFWGMLHGICFDERVHGQAITRRAVRAILDRIFELGYGKISAWFFADNERVRKFLSSLGAVEEGYLHRQTKRAGVDTDMRLVAFFKEDF